MVQFQSFPPVRRSVEAVIRQEIVVELPEDVERDASVGGEDVVVGLGEHGVEVVEGEVLGQQLVAQLVHLQQGLKFLDWKERNVFEIMIKERGLFPRTTMPVMSPASNLAMARSRLFWRLLLILWQTRRLRSIDRPRSWTWR